MIFLQVGQVVGDDLYSQQAHLVGRLFAPPDPLRWLVGVGGVIRRIVVVGVELDDRPLGELDGRAGTGTGLAS